MGGIVYKSGINHESACAELSVVVITLNEEQNISGLLNSIPKLAEVIIVDSGSSDQTCHIARAFGARVEHRTFDDFASQKNFAMSLATRPWTLSLDADEKPDPLLWANIGAAIAESSSKKSAYQLRRRLVFLGRKMRFGRTQDKVLRLFRSHSLSYQNEIHETIMVGPDICIKILGGTLWHYSYRDLDDYFAKFNRYTSMMAVTRWSFSKTAPIPFLMAVRLPMDFFVRYFIKLGVLDGWPGFLWAALSSFYSLVKYAKLREISTRAAE